MRVGVQSRDRPRSEPARRPPPNGEGWVTSSAESTHRSRESVTTGWWAGVKKKNDGNQKIKIWKIWWAKIFDFAGWLKL